MCNNQVSQYIPNGSMDWREIELPCGSTGIDGDRLMCDECSKQAETMYPQGWRNTPGDTCKHGTYIGDAYGPDYICGHCEDAY